MKAMILAAGLGTRMAPLSARRPKPVLPVLDQPMILRMIERLAELGVEEVVVNAHAHGEQLEKTLAGASLPFVIAHEPVLLGSAGALRAARPHLGEDGPFAVINADMAIELDLGALRRAHESASNLATLLLRDDPRQTRFGSIGYSNRGEVCRITSLLRTGPEVGSGLFTGVQIMSPGIFAHIPDRDVSQLMPDVYVPLLRAGDRVGCALQSPSLDWSPIGDPRELLEVNLQMLRRRSPSRCVHPSARVEGEVLDPAWIGPGARVPADARIGPDVVVGADARVPPGCRATESLFLAGARPQEKDLRRAIAFDDEIWRDA